MPNVTKLKSAAQQLDPLSLPLKGRHLIEASAGTGKTFNITRLYCRLLLEQELSVTQILVMTFTNAATEEIKQRVAEFMQSIADEWDSPKTDFCLAMQARVDIHRGQDLLDAALLEMDQASIFTIHGFCQRVLSQFAVSCGTSIGSELAPDTSDIALQAVQDFIRCAAHEPDTFALLSEQAWDDPDVFYRHFRDLIETPSEIDLVSLEQLQEGADFALQASWQAHTEQRIQVKDEVMAHEPAFRSGQIELDKFNAAQQAEREEEWQSLLQWLNADEFMSFPAAAGRFINGNRYRSQAELKPCLVACRALKDALAKNEKSIAAQLQKRGDMLPALQLVYSALSRIKQQINQQKQQQGIMAFDDIISQVHEHVVEDQGGVVAAVQRQFPVALVDEFQDTDPQQYAILDRLYPAQDEQRLLLMIGDPKQAIYGFRGGDVFAYLSAKEDATYAWRMDTNWRSSAQMILAYNQLFNGMQGEHEAPRGVFDFGIEYQWIKSTELAEAAKAPLFDPQANRKAMSFLISEAPSEDEHSSDDKLGKTNKDTKISKDQHKQAIAAAISREIRRLLSEVKIGERDVLPQDIAILVKDRFEAQIIKNQLAIANLSAVYLSERSALFESAEARELLRVLQGLFHCEQFSHLVALSTSSLIVGKTWSDAQLTQMQKDDSHPSWEAFALRCRAYRQQWINDGCFTLLIHLIKHNYCPQVMPERGFTNMMHLAESIAKIESTEKLPLQQLRYLQSQMAGGNKDQDLQLRLESDQALIKIITQHSSKGLEYPVVFVPFASEYKDPTRSGSTEKTYYPYHDPDTRAPAFQLGTNPLTLSYYRQEQDAEAMRLLYVAVTRAKYRCYLGFVLDSNCHQSALSRALGLSADQHSEGHKGFKQRINAEHIGALAIDEIHLNSSHVQHETSLPDTAVSQVQRQWYTRWRMHSFSSLSRMQSMGQEHTSWNRRETDDEHREGSAVNLAGAEPRQEANATPEGKTAPLALQYTLVKGSKTGNMLHDILEHVDFQQADWATAMALPLANFSAGHIEQKLVKQEQLQEELQVWMQACLDTPLRSTQYPTTLCLSALSRQQTLRESEFYYPANTAALDDLREILNDYRAHVAAQYAKHTQAPLTDLALAAPSLKAQHLEGMMHGFIDLIFEHDGQYFVADYKSTHLGDSAEDYASFACWQNNQQHLYDLQYLLYSLSLHRYLARQLPDYCAKRHLGGVFYLYLRGMTGKDSTTGVFFDQVPVAIIERLDACFRGNQASANGVGANSDSSRNINKEGVNNV